MGPVGFYRDFIKNFAVVSEPLRQLTKEHTKFLWSQECEKAFVALKNHLISEPVLAFPITNKEFIIEVDASKEAVGGVLLQEQHDGVIKPVSYCSYALSLSQQNWETYSQEVYALVLAVRKWHVYLFGNKFTFRSDHDPLKTIRNKKDPRGKIANWLMELEEYEYEIQHIKGTDNTKADCLSRSGTTAKPPPSRLEEHIFAISNNFKEQIQSAQDNDSLIQRAKREIAEEGTITAGRLKRVCRQLRMEDGVLTKSGRPVVPGSMQKYVVEEFHKVGDTKSHFGVEKTYELLRERFYWPNMFDSVRNFVAGCRTCQQCKSVTKQPRAPLVPLITPSKPMDFLSIDIVAALY